MGGRQKGSLNQKTKNYLDLQLWYSKAMEELNQFEEPKERFQAVMQILNFLMAKVANLPTTPVESVENALRAQTLIKALETTAKAQPVEVNGTPAQS
jgi:hypothetical protein